MTPETITTIDNETTALELLRAIDSWAYAAPIKEANALWGYLTALRGPDSEDDNIKGTTTARIRGFALPHLARRVGAAVGMLGYNTLLPEGLDRAANRLLHDDDEIWAHERHFAHHILWASRAIKHMLEQEAQGGAWE
jgi:hypothetical protein